MQTSETHGMKQNKTIITMKEELVTFKTAKLASEKGFNIPCKKIYSTLGELWDSHYETMSNDKLDSGAKCTAPTQSLLQKWLREVHTLHIEIFLSDNSPYTGYYYRVMTIGKYFTTSYDGILSDKFEEALEAGLHTGIMLISL